VSGQYLINDREVSIVLDASMVTPTPTLSAGTLGDSGSDLINSALTRQLNCLLVRDGPLYQVLVHYLEQTDLKSKYMSSSVIPSRSRKVPPLSVGGLSSRVTLLPSVSFRPGEIGGAKFDRGACMRIAIDQVRQRKEFLESQRR
jgi:hypothetical protein